MNIDSMNVHGFYSNAVIECDIATIIGKADRIIPRYISYFKNDDNECPIQNQQKDDNSIVAINTKRLGLNWHHQNMHRRKRFSLGKNFINNGNFNCCSLNDQRLGTSRIPITSSHHTIDMQCFTSYSEYCSVPYEKFVNLNIRSYLSNNGRLSTLHDDNVSSKSSNTTAFNKETTKCVNGYDKNKFLRAKSRNRWRHRKLRTMSYSSILYCAWILMARSYFQQQNCKIMQLLIIILLTLTQYPGVTYGLLVSKVPAIGLNFTQLNLENSSELLQYRNTLNSSSINHLVLTSSTEDGATGGAYLEKLDNLERSLAAVLIKVAYGTTSTTKRSIPENSYVPSLTTIATPLLTTHRYQDKLHQTQTNVHHRNYELDLERDHALPTSAPNADILKSNSNPTYPNPNRHHNHERDRHRHVINSTPQPSLPNILMKSNGQLPTLPMFPGGDILSYSPPARSFFTPPLPPEYQHPFADKPTLRGSNNDGGGVVSNTGSYINRRPIPPPSLMPGHERIPYRPPDLVGTTHNYVASVGMSSVSIPSGITTSPVNPLTTSVHLDINPKKDSTAPSKAMFTSVGSENALKVNSSINSPSSSDIFLDGNNNPSNYSNNPEVRKEVLPSIRRILSGSNGRKGDIPDVLLKQVTTRPNNFHQPPSSPVVLIDPSLISQHEGSVDSADSKQNINKNKNMRELEKNDDENTNTNITAKPLTESSFGTYNITSTPSAAAATGSEKTITVYAPVSTPTTVSASNEDFSASLSASKNGGGGGSGSSSSVSSSTSSSNLAPASTHATWSLAWNIHVYLSVILFTILAVYSFYKIITYNKLTHLFSQSYFLCIHLILIIICIARTFYLCYDAYNIHSSFHIFISEILLNLPATFLTITFAVLILFLSLKSLNHKHNRYSALIRPLTVVVGCGVHVVLCITLHYVESYTLQNHQQHLYYQQQQQLLTKRQQQQQQNLHYNYLQNQHSFAAANVMGLETLAFSSSGHSVNFHPQNFTTSIASMPPPPPRVLSLICQIIYIFVCFSLGLLYLYLYRILKRILRSKSQNYIHGYQNLSYAIHITIATALLFVLLAALQIFGAISISSTRPIFTQKSAETDWLQWGYQFSLRLIEIAIITLISWVASLKTSNGSNGTVNINLTNNEVRDPGPVNGTNLMFNTNLSVNNVREKHNVQNSQYNHSNMTNFFLPCTSSSSQEQFDTDYPAVCNANTNLHTYTMRTGKLIYDDNFALNSLNANNSAAAGGPYNDFYHSHQPQYQKQQQYQATYQHPYDSQSLHSSAHHNVSEYGTRINYQPENHLQYNDFLTDKATDHYENPNFDLRGSGSATSGSALVVNSNFSNGGNMQKFAKISISNSTTASSSNNSNMESNSSSASSATSQQQMLLLQGGGETCYSEPIHESYDFNNFEKPKFKPQQTHENWPDSNIHTLQSRRDEKKSLTTLERCGYDKPERRSSNSTHSCNSNTNTNTNNGGVGGGSRYASFNTFERAPFKNVRKSDAVNNVSTNGLNITHGRNNSVTAASSAPTGAPRNVPLDGQTLTSTEIHKSNPTRNLRSCESSKVIQNPTRLDVFPRSTIELSSINKTQRSRNIQLHQPHVQHQYSDEDDDEKDDDIMLTISPHQV